MAASHLKGQPKGTNLHRPKKNLRNMIDLRCVPILISFLRNCKSKATCLLRMVNRKPPPKKVVFFWYLCPLLTHKLLLLWTNF